MDINDGKTYSEISSEARAEGLDPEGETLRGILLNAYGWWSVATIALGAGFAMVAAGLLLDLLHPRLPARSQRCRRQRRHRVNNPEYADATR